MGLLSVGQPCFAKVKGFPAWPAKVTAIQGTSKYEVFFFGTCETASVGQINVWEASSQNMAKFITNKVKKRKFYAVGVEEMNKLVKKQQGQASKDDHSYSSPNKPSKTSSLSKNNPMVIMETLTTYTNAPMLPVKAVKKTITPVKPAVKHKSPVKCVTTSKSPVKVTSKSKSPKSSSPSKPLAHTNKDNHKPRPEEANETEKAKSSEENTLLGRSRTRISRASITPAEKIPAVNAQQTSRRSGKRAIDETGETKQTEKRKNIEGTERIKVNIQLEMSEDAFLRISKELPSILALSGHPIDVNMELQKN